jgi:hypothetical protein
MSVHRGRRDSWRFAIASSMRNFTVSQSLLDHSLDTIEQDGTLPAQLPLTILSSSPRLCHSLSEPFSFFSLLSSFSLRSLVCGTAFLGLSLLTLGETLFFGKGDDLLTTAVVDA